ncbi:MAG: DUF29 domain-containing protein [Mesorhizobium sp.]|nr:DUF29 domain-containing protein [Mesorhizobium sp.]
MNKIFRPSQLTPYEADYAQWCAEQGALLREGRLDLLDRENLAEEIESLGRSQEDEIESRVGVLLTHLLKWRFQPGQRSNSWKATLLEQRKRIARRIRQNPSLRGYPEQVLADEYEVARLAAAGDTGHALETFPDACPFTIEQILDATWLPEAE